MQCVQITFRLWVLILQRQSHEVGACVWCIAGYGKHHTSGQSNKKIVSCLSSQTLGATLQCISLIKNQGQWVAKHAISKVGLCILQAYARAGFCVDLMCVRYRKDSHCKSASRTLKTCRMYTNSQVVDEDEQ
jgi:hypothetical protein